MTFIICICQHHFIDHYRKTYLSAIFHYTTSFSPSLELRLHNWTKLSTSDGPILAGSRLNSSTRYSTVIVGSTSSTRDLFFDQLLVSFSWDLVITCRYFLSFQLLVINSITFVISYCSSLNIGCYLFLLLFLLIYRKIVKLLCDIGHVEFIFLCFLFLLINDIY